MRRMRERCYRATVLLCLMLGLGACGPPAPQNLVLVSLDTTRQDHLSTYGYPRPTSPNLDRIATDGIVFESAVAQWTATSASHASMFTALYPHAHRVGTELSKLSKDTHTLAEILEAAGFRTGAFVSGFTLRGRLAGGLQRGFEVYESKFDGSRRDGAKTLDLALEWLAAIGPDERFFLFLHLFDAHGPYGGDRRFLEEFRSAERGRVLELLPKYQRQEDEEGNTLRHLNDYVDLYDAGLRYQDELLGRLMETVAAERTLVVVLADHGETLGERGERLNLTHSSSVFDEQIRIPFVLQAPGLDAGRFQEVVETVDVLPTALELLEISLPVESTVQGESLAPLLRGERKERREALGYSGIWARKRKSVAASKTTGPRRFMYSVRSQDWKLIVYPRADEERVTLIDLRNDPQELEDVGDQHPEIRDHLLERSQEWLTGEGTAIQDQDLTADEMEKLRALGYLD